MSSFDIKISACPDCGARSDSHPVIAEHDGGYIRECPCGGRYDSGIMGGIEIIPDHFGRGRVYLSPPDSVYGEPAAGDTHE